MEGPDQSHQVVRLIHMSVKYKNKKLLIYFTCETTQNKILKTEVVYPFQLIKMHPKEKRGGADFYHLIHTGKKALKL